MRSIPARVLISVVAATLGVAAAVQAGDLNPPPGPVNPTMKTLSEIEPRTPISALPVTISAPGSYYLTRSLTGLAGQNGITISASNVSIDLSGFELIGVAGSFSGIAVPVAQANISISNGTIRNWGQDGVNGALAVNCQIERLRTFNNVGNGIRVDQGSTVVNCAARNNGQDGVQGGAGCTLVACTGRDNVDDGIQAGAGSTVVACTGSSNDDDGISVGTGCTVADCTAAENLDDGIQADTGSTVRSCTTETNAKDGVLATASCQVVGNTCQSNGAGGVGAGVHVNGTNNRIDGNHVTNNGLGGVKVDLAGNVVIRNTASDNTPNYNIVAGNDVGPIGAAATAVSPWANISF